jgi:glycine/D-amino acid oxidase-like deaminating enzyme
MPALLVVGGGLFGSVAAAYARSKNIEALVFDPGWNGAASHAAAGLFKEEWAGRRFHEHYLKALPVLDRLYGIRRIALAHDDGTKEEMLFVPPTSVVEPRPVPLEVTAVGDGWLEAGGRRHEGWVYIAAGIWCNRFLPTLDVYGKAGAAFVFQGERAGRIRILGHARQAVAFVRNSGTTHFSDGTAERCYTEEHDRQTLEHAAAIGLTEQPIQRLWGCRPYTPKGPVFMKLGSRSWLATGGRKMGTILGTACACRLIEEELRL